jgi:hypothetical protein
MKRINLNKIQIANKNSHYIRERLHCVFLGNGLKCYFSNLKEAQSFVAQTNKMLNQSAQELNRIFIEAWSEQRKIYLTYHRYFLKMKNKNMSAQLERQFDLMCTRSSWENGNYFTFTYFYSIIETIDQWITEIIKMLTEVKKNYNIDDFRVIRERLAYLKQKIDGWGQVYNDREPPCPYDKSKKVSLSGVDDKEM